MEQTLQEAILSHLSVHRLKEMAVASIGLFILFNFIALLLLVNLPDDFLIKHQERRSPKGLPVLMRKILGVLFILIGAVLSLPGVVGPGFIFILMGLMFLGVIGPDRLKNLLVSRPSLLDRINRLRVKFKKPPLIPPPEV